VTYLLDTNVVSELRKPNPHGGVRSWIESVDARQLFVSAVTCGEIQLGIEKARVNNPNKAAAIENWLNTLIDDSNILPLDENCFRQWARLMHNRSDSLIIDAMIAATALVNDLKVVTRNVADFDALGVETLNPWTVKQR